MKSPEWKPEAAALNEKWEARKPLLFPREYFNLQFEFAKALQRKSGGNLLDIIKTRTSSLRFGLYEYNDDNTLKGEKPGLTGITEEGLADFAYANYLKKDGNPKPAEYHPKDSTRFGCFYYDHNKADDSLRIHFVNAEFDAVGPLDKSKIEERKREIRDMLADIKANFPEQKEINGLSWLYNLDSYKRLFPESYTRELEENKGPVQWARGTTIWGQFMDNKLAIKNDLAQELMKRVNNLMPGQELSDVFKEGPPLMPPLTARGSLNDFYEMYKI